MDNKQDRQLYWEVKQFLNKTPSAPAPKAPNLKDSVNSILKENKPFRQNNFNANSNALEPTKHIIGVHSNLEKANKPSCAAFTKNGNTNPFNLNEGFYDWFGMNQAKSYTAPPTAAEVAHVRRNAEVRRAAALGPTTVDPTTNVMYSQEGRPQKTNSQIDFERSVMGTTPENAPKRVSQETAEDQELTRREKTETQVEKSEEQVANQFNIRTSSQARSPGVQAVKNRNADFINNDSEIQDYLKNRGFFQTAYDLSQTPEANSPLSNFVAGAVGGLGQSLGLVDTESKVGRDYRYSRNILNTSDQELTPEKIKEIGKESSIRLFPNATNLALLTPGTVGVEELKKLNLQPTSSAPQARQNNNNQTPNNKPTNQTQQSAPNSPNSTTGPKLNVAQQQSSTTTSVPVTAIKVNSSQPESRIASSGSGIRVGGSQLSRSEFYGGNQTGSIIDRLRNTNFDKTIASGGYAGLSQLNNFNTGPKIAMPQFRGQQPQSLSSEPGTQIGSTSVAGGQKPTASSMIGNENYKGLGQIDTNISPLSGQNSINMTGKVGTSNRSEFKYSAGRSL